MQAAGNPDDAAAAAKTAKASRELQRALEGMLRDLETRLRHSNDRDREAVGQKIKDILAGAELMKESASPAQGEVIDAASGAAEAALAVLDDSAVDDEAKSKADCAGEGSLASARALRRL